MHDVGLFTSGNLLSSTLVGICNVTHINLISTGKSQIALWKFNQCHELFCHVTSKCPGIGY